MKLLIYSYKIQTFFLYLCIWWPECIKAVTFMKKNCVKLRAKSSGIDVRYVLFSTLWRMMVSWVWFCIFNILCYSLRARLTHIWSWPILSKSLISKCNFSAHFCAEFFYFFLSSLPSRPLVYTISVLLPASYLIGLIFTLKTHSHIYDIHISEGHGGHSHGQYVQETLGSHKPTGEVANGHLQSTDVCINASINGTGHRAAGVWCACSLSGGTECLFFN